MIYFEVYISPDKKTEIKNRERIMKKNTRLVVWIIGAILVAAILIVAMVTSATNNKTVATVDGQNITKEELYNTLVKSYGKDALDQLIADKIVSIEADKHHITVTESEIQKQLQALYAQYGGEEALKAQLKTSGSTADDLKKDIKTYLITKKIIEPTITVSDTEISQYFEQNKASFAQKEQVEASHILVKDKATADKVWKELKAGGDFAKLAKQYSMDSTAANGGQLGYFGKGQMVPAFEKVAFSLGINEISKPVKTEYGYHIIKVTGKKEAKEPNLEDNKAAIKEALKNQKMQSAYATWLEQKKAEYKITNNLGK